MQGARVRQECAQALQAAGHCKAGAPEHGKLIPDEEVTDTEVALTFTAGGKGQASACGDSAGCRAKQQPGARQHGGSEAEAEL